MKLTITQHLFISVIAYVLLAFEIISFPTIIDHPYMLWLITLLSAVGSYHLTTAGIKLLKRRYNNEDKR